MAIFHRDTQVMSRMGSTVRSICLWGGGGGGGGGR